MKTQEVMQTFIANSSLQLLVLAAIPLIFAFRRLLLRDPLPPKTPQPSSNDYPIVGAFDFFSRRWDFFQQAVANSPTGNFSFHLGKIPVIGLSGLDARRVFLESKQLDLNEGYASRAYCSRCTAWLWLTWNEVMRLCLEKALPSELPTTASANGSTYG